MNYFFFVFFNIHHAFSFALSLSSQQKVRSAAVSFLDRTILPQWLIQWRGEGAEGYSMSLRQLEFTSSFRAELTSYLNDNLGSTGDLSLDVRSYVGNIHFKFIDALKYRGPVYDSSVHCDATNNYPEPIPFSQVEAYESAMQYVIISDNNSLCGSISIVNQADQWANIIQSTVERCSLIRTMLKVVAEGDSYESVAADALARHAFNDLMSGEHAYDTWSIRLRRYTSDVKIDDKTKLSSGTKKNPQYQSRYGKNVRSSIKDEKNAIMSMSNLVKLFQGKVDLKDPNCKIYVLEGLRDFVISGASTDERKKVLLARVVASGPKTSMYSPKTRICITTTPLCPIASFTLCNMAQTLRNTNTKILDPFAGSCATLLAAAHITNGQCQSVGVEICHNGYVNRDHIHADFETRSLPTPFVIKGDCLDFDVRERARHEIGGDAFDTIITDPPYGIRESMASSQEEPDNTPPLTKLFRVMGEDRSKGKPLLKVGGRLAAFIPVRKGQTLADSLPPKHIQSYAGLIMEGEGKEQVLNDVLSRWLVSFYCVQ